MLLKLSAIFCLAFVLTILLDNCTSGPLVTVCIVDSVAGGYQCQKNKDKGYFLTFQQVDDFECASPADTELFLKNCEEHSVTPISYCKFDLNSFDCTNQDGSFSKISISDADNYVCMSSLDHQRILERCSP